MKLIKTEEECDLALKRIDELLVDSRIDADQELIDELHLLTILVADYEQLASPRDMISPCEELYYLVKDCDYILSAEEIGKLQEVINLSLKKN